MGPENLHFYQFPGAVAAAAGGEPTLRTMFSISHSLRAVFSHAIWVIQPLKTENCPISVGECGVQVDSHTPVLSSVLWASGPGNILREMGAAGGSWEIRVKLGQM